MRRILAMVTMLTISATALSAEVIKGAWTMTEMPRPGNRGDLHLSITRSGNWSHTGMPVRLNELQGLTLAQVRSTTQTPVQFRIASDAGTVTFDGTFRTGDGAGQFTFAPNRDFFQQVRALGVTVKRRENRTEEEELYSLAILRVSLPYVREMHALFPQADLRELSKMAAVGVTPKWLAEMRAVGVEIKTSREATQLAALDVTPAFVRELAAAGYANLTNRQLIKLKATGVDAKFIRDITKSK